MVCNLLIEPTHEKKSRLMRDYNATIPTTDSIWKLYCDLIRVRWRNAHGWKLYTRTSPGHEQVAKLTPASRKDNIIQGVNNECIGKVVLVKLMAKMGIMLNNKCLGRLTTMSIQPSMVVGGEVGSPLSPFHFVATLHTL